MGMMRVDKYDAYSWIASTPAYADVVKVQIDAFNDSQKATLDKRLAEARDEGRIEIWNMMRRIMLPRREETEAYTIDQIREAFGVCNMTDVLKMPLTDAMAYDKKLTEKIKREREKLHVGDEVEFTSMFDQLVRPDNKDSNLRKGWVIDAEVDGCPNCVRVLLKGDGTRVVSINTCKKTGKHNPDIVKAMKSL